MTKIIDGRTVEWAATLAGVKPLTERNIPRVFSSLRLILPLNRGEISDAKIDELAGIGGPDEVRAALHRYRDASATLVTVGPFGGHDG